MPTPVYQAVASESRGRSRYSDDLHERIDNLVEEWLERPEGSSIPYAASNRAFSAEVEGCDTWVRREYAARYAADDRPFGCPVFIIMAILSGIISWIVMRTLDRMFPRGGDSPNIVGSDE